MAKFADRVKVTVDSSTSGTGAVTLSTAVSGYQAVPSALDGASIRYVIELGTAWEIGLGVYTHSTLNLTRSLTSSSTGSLLSLNNTAVVFISPAAEDLQYVEVYSSTSDLPSASSNHGRLAHVHNDGAVYFAHGGNWVRLGNHSDITSYSNATTSAAGLMSSADKTKLDGVATSANNYALPTASSSTLGGIKIGTGLSIDGSGVVTASAGSAADATNYSVTSYTASAGSNTFNASSSPALPAYQAGKLAVYVNGVLQPASGYTATNGTSVVMTLAANDEVSIVNHGKLTGSVLDLSDTPSSFGTAGQVLQVNSGTNALEFADASAGAVVYATAALLPLTGNSAGDMAYVTATNRFYINNGSGWYSVSLVNTNPNITSVQDAGSNTTPFTLATDGTASVITITAADPEEVPLTYGYSVTTGSLTNGGGTTATVVQGTGSNTNVFTVTPTTTEAYGGTFTITFTASDGINQATSSNVFSLSFAVDWSSATQEASVKASTPVSNTNLGKYVSMDGDGNIAGATVYEGSVGAFHIFSRSGTSWSQAAKLTPSSYASDAGPASESICVSNDGTYAVFGGIYDNTHYLYAGAAYVFAYASGSWSQQAKLVASDASSVSMGRLGSDVDINEDNDTIIVGAMDSTAAYVFTRSGTTWSQQAKLTPTLSSNQTANKFGNSVSISADGDTVAVGAYEAQLSGQSGCGGVFIFTRSGTTWSQQAILIATDAAVADSLSKDAVSLSGDGNTLAAGAPNEDSNSLSDSGAAYIFTRSGTTWGQEAKLLASDAAGSDKFGCTISINADGNAVIIGASDADISGDSNAGAAYVFQKSNSSWSQEKKLTASNSGAGDKFGNQVSMSKDGAYAVSGAPFEDTTAGNSGMIYIYKAG